MTKTSRLGSAAALAATILLSVGMLAVGSADAAFPGSNGRIAFASDHETIAGHPAGDLEIFTINPDGSGLTQLTVANNLSNESDPTFSPDGKKIAFVTNNDIWVMNPDGGDQTRLTTDVAADTEPAWSPDGTRIAFRSNRTGGGDVYVMDADGSSQTNLTAGSPKVDAQPVWSPNGQSIAFASTRDEAPGTQNYDVFTMNPDGTSPTNITNRIGQDLHPNWSPDGTRIAFSSSRDAIANGNYEIYTMNANDSAPIRVTDHVSRDEQPAFSPDGARISFVSNRGLGGMQDADEDLWVTDADGSGTPALLMNVASREFQPDWQPLNADLALTKTDSPDPVTAGQELSYTLTVTNNGPNTAVEAAATDRLPAGLEFVSASAGCNESDGTVVCDLGNLPDGATATATITVRPAMAAASTISNAASVSGSIRDPDPTNNSDTEQTTVNHPPDAVDDVATTAEDTPLTFDVLANDTDLDGDPLTLTANTEPSHGSASCTPAGECSYVPDPNYEGSDTFEYTTSDGRGGTDTATVNPTIEAVNDTPVAYGQSVTTDEDVAKNITLVASDVEDDPLTYSTVGGPAHGTLSGTGPNLTYTPDPDYNGPDSFTFEANDGSTDSNAAEVEITVYPVDEPPPPNTAPTITGLRPTPGSTTRNRTPTIEATVRDAETDLTRTDISLLLDGRARTFSYDRTTNKLTFVPGKKLSFSLHTAKIVARDAQRLSTTRTWSFKVARR